MIDGHNFLFFYFIRHAQLMEIFSYRDCVCYIGSFKHLETYVYVLSILYLKLKAVRSSFQVLVNVSCNL